MSNEQSFDFESATTIWELAQKVQNVTDHLEIPAPGGTETKAGIIHQFTANEPHEDELIRVMVLDRRELLTMKESFEIKLLSFKVHQDGTLEG